MTFLQHIIDVFGVSFEFLLFCFVLFQCLASRMEEESLKEKPISNISQKKTVLESYINLGKQKNKNKENLKSNGSKIEWC